MCVAHSVVQATALLAQEANFVTAPTPSVERPVIVVGDLHGQSNDLRSIFERVPLLRACMSIAEGAAAAACFASLYAQLLCSLCSLCAVCCCVYVQALCVLSALH